MILYGLKNIDPKQLMIVFFHRILKKTFQGFVDSGQIPNMLLSGLPGVGKTTVSKGINVNN